MQKNEIKKKKNIFCEIQQLCHLPGVQERSI